MIGAQHCQATPRTLFPPWWGYRAGTCAVPNPTKFFARSAGRGSLRHTPPPTVVGWCLHAMWQVLPSLASCSQNCSGGIRFSPRGATSFGLQGKTPSRPFFFSATSQPA